MIFFALLLVWLGYWMPMGKPRHWLLVSATVFALSIVIETIQSQVGREASWQDVLRNLLGAWLGLFWGLHGDWRVWIGRLFATTLLGWQMFGLMQTGLDHLHRQHQFPVLSDFESVRDLSSWSGSVERVTGIAAQGRYSLAIHLRRGRFSGVNLEHLHSDWQDYEFLYFSVRNPDVDELPLTLRINDLQHDLHGSRVGDRFNQRLQVQPGWNHYRVALRKVREAPQNRNMDLGQIQQLGIFATDLSVERMIFLDDMRLE